MTAQRWQTLLNQMTEIGLVKPGTLKSDETFALQFLNTATSVVVTPK